MASEFLSFKFQLNQSVTGYLLCHMTWIIFDTNPRYFSSSPRSEPQPLSHIFLNVVRYQMPIAKIYNECSKLRSIYVYYYYYYYYYLLYIGYSPYVPQTNRVPRGYTVAATLSFYCQYAVRCVSPSFLRWF